MDFHPKYVSPFSRLWPRSAGLKIRHKIRLFPEETQLVTQDKKSATKSVAESVRLGPKNPLQNPLQPPETCTVISLSWDVHPNLYKALDISLCQQERSQRLSASNLATTIEKGKGNQIPSPQQQFSKQVKKGKHVMCENTSVLLSVGQGFYQTYARTRVECGFFSCLFWPQTQENKQKMPRNGTFFFSARKPGCAQLWWYSLLNQLPDIPLVVSRQCPKSMSLQCPLPPALKLTALAIWALAEQQPVSRKTQSSNLV